MTVMRPATKWNDTGWSHYRNHWFTLRRDIYDRVLSRQIENPEGQYSRTYYWDYRVGFIGFTDDYFDIATMPSFVNAADDEGLTLTIDNFFDTISGAVLLELRHFWITHASGIRSFEVGYWRNTHYNRYTNNPRLCELTDSL